MFAHCLLPALLLLAALDSCTSLRSLLVKTEVIVGDPNTEHGRNERFHIPDGHCYGILITSQQKPLACPEGAMIGGVTVIVFDKLTVNVTVTNSRLHMRDHVEIIRRSCSGKAYVFVEVACTELRITSR